jgi:hypothetical protein
MSENRPRLWSRPLVFISFQVLFLSAAVAATTYRWHERTKEMELPALRPTPLAIEPRYDCPWIVSDEQLKQVLTRLYPRLRGPEPKINFVDHAFRFWGPDAVFNDPEALSGEEMRDLLLNHEVFAKAWPGAPPFLIDDPDGYGVAFRTREGHATASHTDHTLASLAEAGTPLDYPIVTPEKTTTYGDLLRHSLHEFSLNQMEYEWSTLAYVLFVPPTKRWFSTEGQEITFDRLADRLMRQKLKQGVCYGHHRTHSLVAFLRVDEEIPILSDAGRQRIIDHLQDITRTLIRSQHHYGYWGPDWQTGVPPEHEDEHTSAADALKFRILSTGHIMEWMSQAPEEIHPPREVLVRAGQWLVGAIEELELEEIKEQYPFVTHVGNGLAYWRGYRPADFVKERILNTPESSDTNDEQE